MFVDIPKTHVAELPRAPIYDIAKLTDERTQTLKRLLEEGHATMAPLHHEGLKFHTHLPHLLGSAYRLGASSEQLQDAYDHETQALIRIDDTFERGDKITKQNWRDFRNDKPYTVAYVDYFDREVKESGGNWEKIIERYLYCTPEPLVNGLTGGLGHPFIHLAYAYEFRSAAVATEALSLACTELDHFHQMLERPPLDNATYKTFSLGEVIDRIHQDSRFDGILHRPGFDNTVWLMDEHRDMLLEHWNAWEVTDPLQQLEQVCDLSVLLAISTGNVGDQYDFFLIHLATVAHALVVLWHEIPEERHATVLKEYAMFVIYVYSAQLRRSFEVDHIMSYEIDGRDWKWVVDTALAHSCALDSHFFKLVCAPRAFEEIYGKKSQFYLKAAVKFLDEFTGWTGFG